MRPTGFQNLNKLSKSEKLKIDETYLYDETSKTQ